MISATHSRLYIGIWLCKTDACVLHKQVWWAVCYSWGIFYSRFCRKKLRNINAEVVMDKHQCKNGEGHWFNWGHEGIQWHKHGQPLCIIMKNAPLVDEASWTWNGTSLALLEWPSSQSLARLEGCKCFRKWQTFASLSVTSTPQVTIIKMLLADA